MNNVTTQLGQGVPLAVGAGELLAPAAETPAAVDKSKEPILSEVSLTVTTPGAAEVALQMIDSAHDSAMNTARNMVDSPEERKLKAERQARIEAQENDRQDRQKDIDEKSVEEAHLQDEIAAKREEKA